MKRIVLLEPSISSLNLGDHIIVESVKRELSFLTKNSFVVEQPTQTPIMHFYQGRDARLLLSRESDYKFVCGSNLVWQNMLNPTPQWNFNAFNCKNVEGSILVGVGSSTTKTKVNRYTKNLYTRVLNKEYVHSVRDEATKLRLESIGIKSINTGCATMWSLTEKHCKLIPTQKANRVVFTLTDYLMDRALDNLLVNILCKNYDQVYFWPQGYSDYQYAKNLGILDKVFVVNPNLDDMKKLLCSGDVDYVGTRLHGGILALQQKVRTIILAIDNRAREIKENYNIPSIDRNELFLLETMINSEWETVVNISEDRIREWKAQFR